MSPIPDVGYPPPAGQHYAGGGPDPSTRQADAAGVSFDVGLFAGAVPQGRPVGCPADVVSPQRFPTRPSLEDALASTTIGDDTAAEALPGRVFPVATWDGEPGWGAPATEYR